VLHNTGPAPIVVLDFRLRIDKTEQQLAQTQSQGKATAESHGGQRDERGLLPYSMSWRAAQPALEPAPVGGGRHLPSPFPVEGRRAVERFIEFGRRSPRLLPLRGPYTATVEIKLAHRPSWRPLIAFPLHTELVEEEGQARYIARTNDSAWEA
jgi:hypothetical protein